jgi:hypothetical protein
VETCGIQLGNILMGESSNAKASEGDLIDSRPMRIQLIQS